MTIQIKDEVQEDAVKIGEGKLDIASLEAPEGADEKEVREAEEAAALEAGKDGKGAEKADEKGTETPAQIAERERVAAEEAAALALKEAEQNPDTTKAELLELRGMLRDLRNENIGLRAIVERHDKVQKGDLGDKIEPGELEELQTKLQEIVKTRDFGDVLAAMEVNPKYEDVSKVCTKARFEDLFEVAAEQRVEESKGKLDFGVALLQVKTEVWGMRNPYKYMYELIKEYHPDFVKQEEKKTPEEIAAAKKVADEAELALKNKSAKAVVRDLKPANAPGSVANMGGGAHEQGGWTADRIDAMPETELHKVPRDVYEQYLKGELDK